MFEFERLFVCRDVRISDDGRVTLLDADCEFGASVKRLLVYGRLSAPQWVTDISFSLCILGSVAGSLELVERLAWKITRSAKPDQPRLLMAAFRVSGVLIPRYYQAQVELGDQVVTAGFRIK